MRFRFAIACVSLFAAAQAAPVAPRGPSASAADAVKAGPGPVALPQAPAASRPSAAWLFPIGLTLLAVFRRRTD